MLGEAAVFRAKTHRRMYFLSTFHTEFHQLYCFLLTGDRNVKKNIAYRSNYERLINDGAQPFSDVENQERNYGVFLHSIRRK